IFVEVHAVEVELGPFPPFMSRTLGPEARLPAPGQSPRNLPMGRSSLTLSQTAFNPAVNGMASNKPGASHRKPQSISEKVTTRGFRWTREPTTLGYSRFNANRWSIDTDTTTSTYTGTVLGPNAANSGGSIASGSPTYGTRLSNPLSGPTSNGYGSRMSQNIPELTIASSSPSRKLPTTKARTISAIPCRLRDATTRASPWNSCRKLRLMWSRQLSMKYTRNGMNEAISRIW